VVLLIAKPTHTTLLSRHCRLPMHHETLLLSETHPTISPPAQL